MINILKTEIFKQLQTVEKIGRLYDHIPERFEAFPTVFLSFDRVESGNLDSNHHQRQYFFQIHLFQELTKLGRVEADRNLCALLEEVMDRFDRSDLGGLALKIDAVGGEIESVQTANWPALHGMLVLKIHADFRLR